MAITKEARAIALRTAAQATDIKDTVAIVAFAYRQQQLRGMRLHFLFSRKELTVNKQGASPWCES